MNKKDLFEAIDNSLEIIEKINKNSAKEVSETEKRPHNLQKVLVVNRGEIAKRFFLALHEENIPSVAVVTDVDRGQSWYEFADEVVYIGEDTNYTNIPMVLAAVKYCNANAVYAGYGFLSENHEFVENVRMLEEDVIFMGPNPETMKVMGDKVSSRELAKKHGIPLFESSQAFEGMELDKLKEQIEKIGYPVIVKLSSGGGGKGMYPVFSEDELQNAVESCCRIGKDLYNDSRFYVEKFIQKPVHIEVQVFNGRAVGIRKCAVQRRNQKIIEESGNAFLEDHVALSFLSSAEKLAIISGYGNCGAGTVEFLVDSADNSFGFMEMNTRLQVEYGVTDQTLDIDLAKWQILYYDGRENEIDGIDNIKFRISEKKHAIECRIYAEEPENDYRPSPGTIKEIILPTFNGIRCDFGFTEGDKVLSMYDPMIGKLISFGANREEALIRMERALQELYIRGIKTNVNQLLRIVRSENFEDVNYTNNILNENSELSFDKDSMSEIEDSYYVFSAFAEYIHNINTASRQMLTIVRSDKMISETPAIEVPFQYSIVSNQKEKKVSFVQMEKDSFLAYVDGKYFDEIIFANANKNVDDILIEFGDRPKRIRVDRFTDYNSIRIKDVNNKIKYFQMTVVPEGVAGEDVRGKVSSPFQGTFVNFSTTDIKAGLKVKKGDPLLILSAMKMETVVEAPIDGVIEYVIEDGDLSKLQLSKTSDGRVLGKSIQEGELLARIQPEASKEEASAKTKINLDDVTTVFGKILYKEKLQEILDNADESFDDLLDIFYSMVRGYINNPDIISNLKYIMQNLDSKIWHQLINEDRSEKICNIILHYANIKKIFSPVVNSEGFSFAEEFDICIKNVDKVLLEPSSLFKTLFEEMLRAYNCYNYKVETMQWDDFLSIILFLKNSYNFALRHWPEIARQVSIVGSLDPNALITKKTLRHLYEHTRYQLDDTSTKFIKHVFANHFPEEAIEVMSENIETDKILSSEGCEKTFEKISESNVKAVKNFGENPKRFISNLEKLKGKISFEKCDDVYAAYLKNDSGDSTVFAAFLEKKNKKDFSDSLFDLVKEAAELAENCYSDKDQYLDIYIDQSDLELTAIDSYFNIHELRNDTAFLLKFFLKGIVKQCMIHNSNNDEKNLPVKIELKNNKLVFDYCYGEDPDYLYHTEELSDSDRKMYVLDKWPLEKWIYHCFDDGSVEELIIDPIDNNPDGKLVGAKIFTGKMNGKDACFYMKDYRVIGGATGDLEGAKYGAACYYSFMKNIPLYVWNDSAGANIKQGVVSLNRGGQGFMMNSLLANDVDLSTFRTYVQNIYDKELINVFKFIDDKYKLDLDKEEKNGSTMLIAVGVGASAGLDVYGSSQATIQLILDSENSYRVLTGSNVIKSVLGEDISNYEIGGAGVLGKWTGIADIIAKDKLDLITKIFEIQNLHFENDDSDKISRIEQKEIKLKKDIVVNEDVIKHNVDEGKYYQYKNEYYASNSLICGFSKIAGEKVVILGPRTNYGFKSNSSIIKAREMINIAYKTSTPQVFIVGAKWINNNGLEYDAQNHIDLSRTIAERSQERVLIVTDPLGLRENELMSTSDFVIYVSNENDTEESKSTIRRISTHIVDDMTQAFDVAAKYLKLRVNDEIKPQKSEADKVAIPTDKAQPFDMIKEVISKITDKDTFLEFNASFNKPTGPNLITGLARLEGKVVGIIADQPMIKGGGADALGTKKFRVFTDYLNRKNIPLLMLSNSSGFVPGTQQERYRIQAIGGESLDKNILGKIPVVSLVLNQNFGGRQIHSFSKSLRPGITYIAYEDATIAVMGATAAFDLLGVRKYNKMLDSGEKDKAEAFKKDFLDSYAEKANAKNDALGTGVLDWTFARKENLRDQILKGFEKANEECKMLD